MLLINPGLSCGLFQKRNKCESLTATGKDPVNVTGVLLVCIIFRNSVSEIFQVLFLFNDFFPEPVPFFKKGRDQELEDEKDGDETRAYRYKISFPFRECYCHCPLNPFIVSPGPWNPGPLSPTIHKFYDEFIPSGLSAE